MPAHYSRVLSAHLSACPCARRISALRDSSPTFERLAAFLVGTPGVGNRLFFAAQFILKNAAPRQIALFCVSASTLGNSADTAPSLTAAPPIAIRLRSRFRHRHRGQRLQIELLRTFHRHIGISDATVFIHILIDIGNSNATRQGGTKQIHRNTANGGAIKA